MDVLSAIALAARLAELAFRIGGDALPFILKIKEWADKDGQPTQADFDELNRQNQMYLNILNDTSRDKGV